MKRLSTILTMSALLATTALAHLSPDDSLDDIERKLSESPADVSLLLDKAHVLIIMSRFAEAEGVLKGVDSLETPLASDTAYLYVLLHLRRGELDAAMAMSDEGIARYPENHFQWEIRGETLADSGRTEEAVDAMEKSLRFRETVNELGYLRIADMLLERGGLADKRKLLPILEAGANRVEDPSALLHLSVRLNMELKRFDAALGNIDALERAYGDQVPFAAKRAEVLETAGRDAQAVRAYQEAIARLDALPAEKRSGQGASLRRIFADAVVELSMDGAAR